MAKTTLKSLSDALAARLTEGALPGRTAGLRQDRAGGGRGASSPPPPRRGAPGPPVLALEPIAGDRSDRRMRLAIVNDDMPFLVDSIAAAIGAQGIAIDRIIHPVVRVTRDADGALTDVGDDGDGAESMIYIEMERADARERRELVDDARRATLADVRAAVADWHALQDAMARRCRPRSATSEGAALLRWFLDGNLTLLGHETLARRTAASAAARHRAQRARRADPGRGIARAGDRLVREGRRGAAAAEVEPDLDRPPPRAARPRRWCRSSRARRSPACRSMPGCGPAPRSRTPPQRRAGAARAAGRAGGEVRLRSQGPYRQGADACADRAAARSGRRRSTPAALEELALTAMSLADRPRPKLVLVRSIARAASVRLRLAAARRPHHRAARRDRRHAGRGGERARCSTGRSRWRTAWSR